jgi:DNA recombination protein RmuC
MELMIPLLSALAAAAVVAGVVIVFIRKSMGAASSEADQNRISALETELADSRVHVQSATDARNSAERDIARLEEASSRLATDVSTRDAQLAELTKTLGESHDALSALKTTHEAFKAESTTRAEGTQTQMRELVASRELMKKEFRVLAEEVMRQHGEAFKTQNREQIEGLLGPLHVRLKEFQSGLSLSHKEAAESRVRLEEQIKFLGQQSVQVTKGAEDLTRALKGESQRQGAWGEMVLATILEKSGLRDGEEYSTQSTTTTEDGNRLRPDVIINLPNEHRIVIDSKVSLVAFGRHVNGDTEEERAAALNDHVASLRSHIRGLSGKRYEQELGFTPDYVIMFVPIEGALAAALTHESELTHYALEQNVTIATPTNLMTLLRTVSSIWQVERRNRNAEAIADRAGKLYDKFVGFVSDMESIGARISQTQVAHDAAMNKLGAGRGNLIRQTEDLRKLGARASKSLDPAKLETAGALPLPEGVEDTSLDTNLTETEE